jgi:hypothetical protein
VMCPACDSLLVLLENEQGRGICMSCGLLWPTSARESAQSVDAVDPHAGSMGTPSTRGEEAAKTGGNMPPLHRSELILPCPKCGALEGWTGPEYVAQRATGRDGAWALVKAEHLAYRCEHCGYERREPTKDSQLAEPSSPPSAFPANRVLLEGELPCLICGSGKADHAGRDHTYTRTPRLVPVPAFNGMSMGLAEESASRSWLLVIVSIACALGWYLVVVLAFARMYPS